MSDPGDEPAGKETQVAKVKATLQLFCAERNWKIATAVMSDPVISIERGKPSSKMAMVLRCYKTNSHLFSRVIISCELFGDSTRTKSACRKLFFDVILLLHMNSRIILALVFFTSLLSGTACAVESAASNADQSDAKPWVRKVAFGILLHDVGFISDKRENGVDPNWEVQFNRPEWGWWRWVGSPYPIVGATPNFVGDTSAFYFGFTYEFSLSNKFLDGLTYDLTKGLWISGTLGTAVHTGPLHKNDTKCKEDSDCGFGSRVLPRIALEVGYTFWKNHGLSLFFDHMSHGSLGCSCIQNEGIDHTGIRYHFIFNTNASP